MIRYLKRKIKSIVKKRSLKTTDELMSAIRHECHRIEKTVYNDILEGKFDIYKSKVNFAQSLFNRLNTKQQADPSMQWALKILNAFPDIEESFVTKNKNSNYSFASNSPQVIYDIMKARRSNRKWAIEQPSAQDLHDHALQMIQAAITAPCSGNRQGVRFRIILDEEEKILLKGIKEHHCYSAPLLIFIGAESDVYYSLGESDINCRYLDAAASAMQIINYATAMNYGTCWNHFDKYMVHSRKKNTEIYNNFCKKLNIPSNIEPIAIIAIGKTKYVVPTPVRMDINSFILK